MSVYVILLNAIFIVMTVNGNQASAVQNAEVRPKLQIINGSPHTIDVFWLKDESERIPNGSIAPGRDTIIATTIGHRFAIVDRRDGTESIVTSEVPIQGHRFGSAANAGVPEFYTQQDHANGFPIVASANVNPFAVKEAVYLVNAMLAQRPDVRDAMIKSGSRLSIMAYNEFTTELPEFAHLGDRPHAEFPQLSGNDYWDARTRGTGGSSTDPFCSCAEENLLGFPGDPYEQECILIHEFAHCIHLRGVNNVDPTFDDRLRATYERAMKSGLWKDKYAAVNHYEYFAEGVQSWFDNNRVNDHDHNHVNSRKLLLEYDPGLAKLCYEVFGETKLKYCKPANRMNGHLKGYDPTTAPTFVWPKRLKHAHSEIMGKKTKPKN